MIAQLEATGHLEVVARDVLGVAPGTRAYSVRCPHGATSAALLPGATPLDDAIVVDLVLPGHRRRLGCTCRPAPRTCTPVSA